MHDYTRLSLIYPKKRIHRTQWALNPLKPYFLLDIYRYFAYNAYLSRVNKNVVKLVAGAYLWDVDLYFVK